MSPPESSRTGWLIVQDDRQQGTIDRDIAVVLDESELPELVHEEVHAGARGADDLGQRFLRRIRLCRNLRASMWARKRSASAVCVCRRSSIFGLSSTSTRVALMADAVEMRFGCPARQPSPKKSP